MANTYADISALTRAQIEAKGIHYCGRSRSKGESVLGNPWTHLPTAGTNARFHVDTAEEAIERYRRYLKYCIKLAFGLCEESPKAQTLGIYKKEHALAVIAELLTIGPDTQLGCHCRSMSVCHTQYVAAAAMYVAQAVKVEAPKAEAAPEPKAEAAQAERAVERERARTARRGKAASEPAPTAKPKQRKASTPKAKVLNAPQGGWTEVEPKPYVPPAGSAAEKTVLYPEQLDGWVDDF